MTDATPDARPYPPTLYAWYVATVLYLAYTLAFVDRQIMAFIVGPIRADLHLTDFQFSLLHGFAFVIFYSVLGLPIARLADRHSRRLIIVVGVALWSLMTATCGLARNYLQLFLARLGVGVGEATLSPSAISLIADYFPTHRRALPLSLYSAGVQAGAGIASIGGGLVVAFAMSGQVTELPVLGAVVGALRPWQAALILVGLPGLLVSALALTIREPQRRRHAVVADAAPVAAVLPYLREHRSVYATLIFGAALTALANYGAFSWVPSLFMRRWHWSPAQIGTWLGLATFVFGTLGLMGCGLLATRLVRRGVPAAYSKIMAVTMGIAVLPSALLVATDDPYWAMGCVALMVLTLSAPIGLVQAALQSITPVGIRAQVTAVYLLVVTLVGLALGPSLVAAFTDYVFHDDVAVGKSIAIVASLAAAASAAVFVLGIGAYRRKVEDGLH